MSLAPTYKARIALGFRNAQTTYDACADVQLDMGRRLIALLEAHSETIPARAFEIGCGTGTFTEGLMAAFPIQELFLNDLVQEIPEALRNRIPAALPATYLMGDIECLEVLPDHLDLVASNACLQWMTDLPRLLKRLHGCLRPGGHLLFSTFGPKNLEEVAHLAGPGLAYRTLPDLREVIGKAFDIIHLSEAPLSVTFPDPAHLLRHLRATGVNGVRQERLGPGALRRFMASYAERFPQPGGGVRLTYHPIHCLARRPLSV